MTTTLRRYIRLAVVAALAAPAPAYAQLDPLLFLKNVQPNVILAVDTSNRMQRDADETWYDPGTYSKDAYEGVLGLPAGSVSKTYRRKFFELRHSNINDVNERFVAHSIGAVGDLQTTAYNAFGDAAGDRRQPHERALHPRANATGGAEHRHRQ
jgi:hypothetical protein